MMEGVVQTLGVTCGESGDEHVQVDGEEHVIGHLL